ncbi:endonuclease [archaeon]|nr:MAG: endonuclease [archaeon]
MKHLYRALSQRFGRLEWWPIVDKRNMQFEIILGAILTQQASWKSVEMVIRNLTDEKIATPQALASADVRKIQKAIRPTGFYKQKANRIKGVAKYIVENYGGVGKMFGKDTGELRKELLSLKGVGKETADDILLYAAERAIVPIDAYTYRILSRLGMISGKESYDELQEIVHEKINDVESCKQFHALIVEHAKQFCKKKPSCEDCPLSERCAYPM